jgi:hypothetical protein
MSRYFSAPRALFEGNLDAPITLGKTEITVHEPEASARRVGIVDHRGDDIYSTTNEAAGFIPVGERE